MKQRKKSKVLKFHLISGEPVSITSFTNNFNIFVADLAMLKVLNDP
jgi:hypothetical protein